MGIPPAGGIGDDCLACFAADKTPLVVWAKFVGIERGDLWNPGDLEPPNGLYELTQFAPCAWFVVQGPFTVNFGCANPGTGIDLSITGIRPCFTFASLNNCVWGGANQLAPPAWQWYINGGVQITWSL